MNNKEKAINIGENNLDKCFGSKRDYGVTCALEMARWKDEQYKTAYVVTRSDLHWDEVERVFFDKNKAEEYCKPFNEDKDCYHRNITEIEVSL